MSTYNFPMLNRLAKKLGGETAADSSTASEEHVPTTSSTASSTQEDTKAAEDAVKEEKYLSSILEVTRKLYYEKGIVGSIDVIRSFTIYSSSIHCEVDGTNITAFVEELNHEGESSAIDSGSTMFERRMRDAIKGAVSTLKHRARAYRGKSYRRDLILTCGITLTDPFLGMISTSVTCSATVASLLDERGVTKSVDV